MSDGNPWVVVGELAGVLEALGLRYAVGGSLASSVSGEPRSTQDADVSVDLKPEHVEAIAEALADRFYVPIERLRRAAREHMSVNLIHRATAMKIDIFVAGGTSIDEDVLRRRMRFSPESVPRALFVYTPEDVLLHKLRWYRLGGESSERRDIMGIVRVQGGAGPRLSPAQRVSARCVGPPGSRARRVVEAVGFVIGWESCAALRRRSSTGTSRAGCRWRFRRRVAGT